MTSFILHPDKSIPRTAGATGTVRYYFPLVLVALLFAHPAGLADDKDGKKRCFRCRVCKGNKRQGWLVATV